MRCLVFIDLYDREVYNVNKSKIDMTRKGVVAIIFKKEKGKVKFLLLKRKKNWKGWELMKGGCKNGESELMCLRREVKEETGISKFITKITNSYDLFGYPQEMIKDGVRYKKSKHRLFLIEVFSDKVEFDKEEHSGFKWVDFEKASKMLTWKDQKALLKKFFRE